MSAPVGVGTLGLVEEHRVELVVLNWNEREFLEVILPSIERQTYRDLRVTVADNGSTDDSIEYVQREWPDVRVVRNSENLGVAAGWNTGIRSTRAEYVGLVNNDVELDPRWLESLVAALDAHPTAAAVCGKQLRFDDREVLDGAGDVLGPLGLWGRRGFGERDRGQYDVATEVDGAGMVAALYRREAFDVVGVLDEDLHSYLEDSDWSFRAGIAGYSLRYEPRAVAYHMGGATNRKLGDFTLYHLQRNSLALVAKDWTPARLRADGPRFLWHQLKTLLDSPRHGTTRVLLRGWWAGLRLVPAMVRKRRDVFSRTRPAST
jgi:GT2 family glycosyltransferase